VTFGNPLHVHPGIGKSDKPWIAVDNAAGTGLHDVYLTCTSFANPETELWLAASTDGSGSVWTNAPVSIRKAGASNVKDLHSLIIAFGTNHVGYMVWWERTTDEKNWIRTRAVSNRGATLSSDYPVSELVNANDNKLHLKRSNSADSDDTFNAYPFPVLAVNPTSTKANHLYVAYADKAQNPNDSHDRADVFFVRSTNGGANWTAPVRISTVQNRDQWMPVITVKADGTKLFAAWYDRRNDSNNSLIDVYGRFGTINADGSVTFNANDFKITTQSFPPVFAGTLAANKTNGYYDPVYPPE
jgi:hypothetical protein